MSNNNTDINVETAVPARNIVRNKSVTMEYFLETTHLDEATADLLRQYDADGNGSFSKEEVVAIIVDLREAIKSNKMLGESNKLIKRLLLASIFFCVILLTSMFGLSYAVAAITAKTDVNSAGLMVSKDGSVVIATDSTATMHHITTNEEGAACVTTVELAQIETSTLEGRNVLIETSGNNTHTAINQVTAGGYEYDEENDRMCFGTTLGSQVCFEVSDSCVTSEERHRRRLEEVDAECEAEEYDTSSVSLLMAVLRCEANYATGSYMNVCGCKRQYWYFST
eukprot:Nitzschia sp. Nitz4//scaffold173_size47512//11771//12700//NITZ4_007154-RA/size47512-augustus-gene-0.2-mRNA-1//1//CDS//3329538790//5652//frame0